MHRTIESVLFTLGGIVLLSYPIAETLGKLGWRLGAHDCEHGFPWGHIIIGALLVAPKMLGRVTAGRIWDAIGQRFGAQD